MPRMRQRKTDRGQQALLSYEQAYICIQNGKSVRQSAAMFGLNHASLYRYKKKRDNGDESPNVGYRPANKIFTKEQEITITKYLLHTADIYFGLCHKEARRLIYDLAVVCNSRRPATWDDKKLAGQDWFLVFVKRNPEIAKRCAQAKKISRVLSFTRAKVNIFFNNLQKVMDEHHFEPRDIYNMNETGITTERKPDRVVTRKGRIPSGAHTSEVPRTVVTVTIAVNTLGNTVPAMFIFPRTCYSPHFVNDGPVGCIGVGNNSGWMDKEEFLIFLKHFQKHTQSSTTHKVLLLLDNQPSYITILALDFCKANGIVLLSFPPHTSKKLQPVDRALSDPLNRAMNSTCDAWMSSNPEQDIAIHNIPGIVATAYLNGLTPSNIQEGFMNTGIFPFNRQIFNELDFSPSYADDTSLETDFFSSADDVTQNSGPSYLGTVTNVLSVTNTPTSSTATVGNSQAQLDGPTIRAPEVESLFDDNLSCASDKSFQIDPLAATQDYTEPSIKENTLRLSDKECEFEEFNKNHIKIELCKTYDNDDAQGSVSNDDEPNNEDKVTKDEDVVFLNSLLPYIRKLGPQKRLFLRIKMQELVYNTLYNDNLDKQ